MNEAMESADSDLKQKPCTDHKSLVGPSVNLVEGLLHNDRAKDLEANIESFSKGQNDCIKGSGKP